MSDHLHRRQILAAGVAAAGAAAARGSGLAAQEKSAQDLSGRSILITGCSSGFGRLASEHFARLGAKVFATMRDMPRREGQELADLAKNEGLELTVLEIDVMSEAEVARGVRQAEEAAGGGLDVIVNNAGISYAGPVEMQDLEATRHIFETNVFGPHRVARAALPAMRERGEGLILQVSSQLGRVIVPAYGQYSPTKFALEAMSEQMAYEVAPQGIDVTIIEPGGYPTEIWENSARRTEDLLDRTPEALKETYAEMTEWVTQAGAAPRRTDPMDVPRAMAEVIAMPAGERPLRRPVHPQKPPQAAINETARQTQKALLDSAKMGSVARRVLGD